MWDTVRNTDTKTREIKSEREGRTGNDRYEAWGGRVGRIMERQGRGDRVC